MLANVVSLKKNIIITGSHGKTTTTSLVAKILSDQKLDPTIINGGIINSFKTNAKLGKGEWAILICIDNKNIKRILKDKK